MRDNTVINVKDFNGSDSRFQMILCQGVGGRLCGEVEPFFQYLG